MLLDVGELVKIGAGKVVLRLSAHVHLNLRVYRVTV
jgi:hypothetical protein